MGTMSKLAITRLQERVRRAMTDGLPLLASDIVGRLCEQKTTTGSHYRDQPNASQLAYVMKMMPDIERIPYSSQSLWKLIIDEEE